MSQFVRPPAQPWQTGSPAETDQAEVLSLVADIERVFEKAVQLELKSTAYLLEMALLEICTLAYGENASSRMSKIIAAKDERRSNSP